MYFILYSHYRVCVKEHQNNLQTSKIIPRRDRAPGSKFLDPPLREAKLSKYFEHRSNESVNLLNEYREKERWLCLYMSGLNVKCITYTHFCNSNIYINCVALQYMDVLFSTHPTHGRVEKSSEPGEEAQTIHFYLLYNVSFAFLCTFYPTEPNHLSLSLSLSLSLCLSLSLSLCF